MGHITPHCTKPKKDKGKDTARLAANEANTKKQRMENKKRKRAAAKAAKESDSAKLANVQHDEAYFLIPMTSLSCNLYKTTPSSV